MTYFIVEVIEKDFEEGYRIGFEEGYLKGLEEIREEVTSNLLEKLGLSDEQVVSIANAPLKLVQKIRKKLQK